MENLLRRKLVALECPYLSFLEKTLFSTSNKDDDTLSFFFKSLDSHKDMVDSSSLRALSYLLVWIEDRIIRHYPVHEREFLRFGDNLSLEGWRKAFHKYLDDLSCPISESVGICLYWLLTHAVSLELEEKVEFWDKETLMTRAMKMCSERESKSIMDLSNRVFSLERETETLKEYEAIEELKRVQTKLLEIINQGSKDDNQTTDTSSFEERLSGNKLGKAVEIMRLLHAKDLRVLQDRINEMITEAQKFTANPKTDSSLGRVGS